MHKELSSIAIFVAVVEEGGFSKAADKIGLSNSVISHHVTKLEEKLGVTLLYRSTRQVTLSDQGREYYSVASAALKAIEEATLDVTSEGEDPSGTLSIAMPSFVPDPRLQELIWDFANQFGNVDLRISFSDDRKELLLDGFDIAFRLGALESSGMMSSKVTDIELILVASPRLIPRFGKIRQPEDIADWDCIALNQLDWVVTLFNGNNNQEVRVSNKRVEVDNIYAARDAAVAGLGLIPLPLGICRQELEDGTLVKMLPEWTLSMIPLYAVWNNKARRNSLTRRLLSFLDENY